MIGVEQNIFEKNLLLTRGYAGLSLALHPDDSGSNLGKAKFLIFFPFQKLIFSSQNLISLSHLLILW